MTLHLTNPLALAAIFLLFWVAISAALPFMSGWANLAGRFRYDGPVRGERFRFVSASMGSANFPVNYGNSLAVAVDNAGLHLSILFLFRAFSPPLYIPWTQVESVEERRFFFMRNATIRVRGHWPTIALYGKAGRHVLEVYARLAAQKQR